jgi:hypothetical protein
MRTAHFIVFVNTRTLLVHEAGIYSESAQNLARVIDRRHYPMELLSVEGRDYEEARHNVARTVRNRPELLWAFNLLPEADKVPPRKSVPP